MSSAASPTAILTLAFAVAFMFGAIAERTRFCTMGAVADIVTMGDWNRMRMWLLAIGTAILGTSALQAAGFIDVDKSIYRGANLLWLSHLVGGLCFGFGMVLASGCGARTLMRIGSGNLKSVVVFLVMALVAEATLQGALGVLRVNFLDSVALRLPVSQGIPPLLTAAGLPPATTLWLAALSLGGGCVVFALIGREFRQPTYLLGGLGCGLAVVAAWFVSGYLGYLPEDPDTLQEHFIATHSGRMESLTFVGPLAHTLQLFTLWSDASRKLDFGIAGVFAMVAGAWVSAVVGGRFRWEGFGGAADTARHLAGAVLMGFGGVTALGCTIGQGISGVSTLALGAFLSLGSIVVGAILALKYEEWRAT